MELGLSLSAISLYLLATFGLLATVFLLVYEMNGLLLIQRPVVDVVFVTIGVFVAETLLARHVLPPAEGGAREPHSP